MKMSVAQVLVRYLKELGVRQVFGLIGHSIFEITDAIYLEPEINFLSVQHELSAAYMAVSYSKAKRDLGVCLVSSGAGATNLLTGMAMAFKESCPVLAISSEVSRKVSGKGASSWHEIPQEDLFRPITKMSQTLSNAEDVLSLVREAVSQATTGRKGPVYLGIPADLQKEMIEVPSPPWHVEVPASHTEVDPKVLENVGDELVRALSPTIILGGGVYWSQCADEVKQLAELVGAPFGTSPSYKGLISEEHPLSLGVFGFGSCPYANKACLESDVILAVGATFSEGMTWVYGNRVIPSSARIIQIDMDPKEIGKIYPVTHGIVGDAKVIINQLIAHIKKRGIPAAKASPRMQRIQDEKHAWREEVKRRIEVTEGPITQWHLYAALRRSISKDTVVVVAGGTGEALQRFEATSDVYHAGELRAIGSGFTTAMGLKLAFPERSVVCVTGDGSFMLELQELATAMSLKLPVVVIVVHNSAYGNMKRDQIRHLDNRVIGTNLTLPDFCALARAFGAYGARVERPSDLVQEIEKATAVGKPALLDVICPVEDT